ncbi:MAG: nucleotidyl transferase AbiEii/AbiGii toxin family protein [Sandaracinaceae bacterium]|nr:nucleotidyl transferase AbiEii/AbiGii toxin family protein [Sandaracinaceae bacterium]
MAERSIEQELGRAAQALRRADRSFALVGGLAAAIRGEVRFTRDIDLAIDVTSDEEAERVVRDLCASGYEVVALVEHESARRLSTARLRSRAGVRVDLLAASSGIEHEIVHAAVPVEIERAGPIPVARAEDLLATKVLSASERRPQDRADAIAILLAQPDIDLRRVREQLRRIRERGFHRDQDLDAKLDALLEAARA